MIRNYLRLRRAPICAVLAAMLIFPFIMIINGIGLTNTAYAAGVYVFVLGLCAITDFIRFVRRVGTLRNIRDHLSDASHAFPDCRNELERQYTEIIQNLYNMNRRERDSLILSNGDQIEYYTMWLHQIKNPISAIRLAIESEHEPNPIYRQELFKIEQYVEMALQYAKLGNLGGDLVLSEYSLDDMVIFSIKKYSDLFIYKNLTVDFRRTEKTLITDSKWFAFVFEQILSNAVKYTAKGGVKMYGGNQSLTIEDSGIGIYPEDIPRIFERGYTGYNGRIDKKASGLGLYMAAKAAGELGIIISVDSRPGEGTRVTLTFSDGCILKDEKERNLTKM